jgi:hypothetical protein
MYNVWGERNETDKWISEKVNPRISHRFGCSVIEGFCAFLSGWRPKIGMRQIGASLESTSGPLHAAYLTTSLKSVCLSSIRLLTSY